MPKTKTSNLTRFVSGLAVLGLILQSIFPIFNLNTVPKAFAANNSWDFSTSGDYTATSKMTINGGYAALDLDFATSSDNLDAYGPTLDLVQTATGRVIAAIGSNVFPRSDDDGSTWGVSGGATVSISATDLKVAGSNIVVAGYDGGSGVMAFSIDDGDSWTTALVLQDINNTSINDISTTVGGKTYAGSTNGTGNAQLLFSSDSGASWGAGATRPSLTSILSVQMAGSRVFVAGTGWSYDGTTDETGVFYTDDDGANWTQVATTSVGNTHTSVTAMDYDTTAGVLYATTNAGYILKSSTTPSAGTPTFTRVTATNANLATDIYTSHLTGVPASYSDIFITLSNGKIMRSINGGSSFFTQNTDYSALTSGYANKIIRFDTDGAGSADDKYLLAIRNDGSNGDAYITTFATGQHIYNNTGVAYSSISAFAETMSTLSETTSLKYRISNDGVIWKYWDGATWTTSDNLTTKISSASSINTNIGTFDDVVGSGTFYFDAVMLEGGLGSPYSAVSPSMILDTVAITYIAASITVITNNGGVDWQAGNSELITWSSVGLGAGDIITLSYTLDGVAWSVIDGTDVSKTPNDGSYNWTVANQATDTAKVRVAAGAVTDDSDAYFRIVYGVGPIGDITPPESEVVDLPAFSRTPFNVKVIATDDSGIGGVKLYYTFESSASDPEQLIQFGATKHGCPIECFEWDFNAPFGEGLYRFYSSAYDRATPPNDNWNNKFADGPSGGFYYRAEAWTRADNTGPVPVIYTPEYDQPDAPINGDITLEFNERTQTETFDYTFYKLVNGLPVSQKDKLGEPEWLGTQYFEGCSPDSQALCALDPNGTTIYTKKVRLHYTNLEHGTTYYFNIHHILDLAGNDVQTNWPEPPNNTQVWSLRFKTVDEIHPDLTQSNLEITNLPGFGKFKAGDKVSFKLNLINSDPTPALATVSIPIASGLTYCSTAPCVPAFASVGNQPLIIIDGQNVTITWTGNVALGQPVYITFDTKIDSPAESLAIEQTTIINDGVHADFERPATVYLEELANWSTSTKLGTCVTRDVDGPCTDAVSGTMITYFVSVINSGTSPGVAIVNDSLKTPGVIDDYISYVSGPTAVSTLDCPTGGNWSSLTYDNVGKSINGTASMAPGDCRAFSFVAMFTAAAEEYPGHDVTNIADIHGLPAEDDPFFMTHVPGKDRIEYHSPVIAYEYPEDQTNGVAPNVPIKVAFTKSVDISTFEYFVTYEDIPVDTYNWRVIWSDFNGKPSAMATITRPIGEDLEIGANYKITISDDVTDYDGNFLADGPLPNPWTFATLTPAVFITMPVEDVVKLGLDEVSSEFVVEILDENTRQPYKVAEDLTIAVMAEVPATGLPGIKRQYSQTAEFALNPEGPFEHSLVGSMFIVTIPAGTNKTGFYFRESVANVVDIKAFTHPPKGWSAASKAVLVSGEPEDLVNRLVIEMADGSMKSGAFSSPIEVGAMSETNIPMLIPETLYFYTESTTGRFFDANYKELNDYITVQSNNPTSNLQYAPNLGGISATFYYMDTVVQSSLITISDNAPQEPDINLENAHAILEILEETPEDILQELEEVEDDTGRILDQVVIDPTKAVLLPGGIKSFAVVALDEDGNEIENAKFKWYVTAGGGKIEKDGIDDDSHQTIFTAGQTLGNFYDTIIVATLYNGKFGFATASVRVSDIVEYIGPARLPMTGISGIQLIFMGLTLLAAIALAWVEHYDKTHFSTDNK